MAGLLHDVGKIVFRASQNTMGKDHSFWGWEFLRNYPVFHSPEIQESVLFHHYNHLKDAKLNPNSAAYITYFADNIASGIDRKDLTDASQSEGNFQHYAPLQSIFNIVREDRGRKNNTFRFSIDGSTQFPDDIEKWYYPEDYNKLGLSLDQLFQKIEQLDKATIDSVIQILEQLLAYIPSSTNTNQLMDISLFDHSKVTSAVALCIYDYLTERQIDNYQQCFTTEAARYYNEEMFMLFSFDMSGIQDFIYNISGENALKSLRARSFYLEILLEHLSDEFLKRFSLNRTNLLYIGGGRATFLLPKSQRTKDITETFIQEVRKWFLDNFKTDLSLAYGSVSCSANTLMNKNGNYQTLWTTLSQEISTKKAQKYNYQEIIQLNHSKLSHQRECRECLRSDIQLHGDLCPICENIIKISSKLLDNDYFIVTQASGQGLILPFNCHLECVKREHVSTYKSDSNTQFIYSKNIPINKILIATTNVWMGDYDYSREHGAADRGIASYVERELGVKRLGVLRADVDNLGATFIAGIAPKYRSISRTVTLSRLLSRFFKYEINEVLSKYRATVIYAGGDDLFIIGAWDDMIKAAINIRRRFRAFASDKLTLSAGIGLYPVKYPVSRMASEVGELEDLGKTGEKNQVVLWYPRNLYNWDVFEKNVVIEKAKLLFELYETSQSISLMYNILHYLSDIEKEEGINLARFAYLLARTKLTQDQIKQLYKWATSPDDRRELLTSLEILIYSKREG